MLYHLYDAWQAMLAPARFTAEAVKTAAQNPLSPLSYMPAARSLAAGAEFFERTTRKFGKPEFGLPETKIDDKKVKVTEVTIDEKPFATLTHFKRDTDRKDPKILIVAPMSGHFSTLLRGTVEALLPNHEVYISEWVDARLVPLRDGRFNLDDYVAYVMDYCKILGPDTHIMAVCQPAVPVFMAVAVMNAQDDKNTPKSMTLMGGPIDPRVSKTAVTELAEQRPLSWFEQSVVTNVPMYYPGAGRRVYPGFMQLSGFMQMNLDRHVGSHLKFYQHLIQGDGEDAQRHRKFYDEYLAVMDLTGEFYLQTVEMVFQKHLLPKGEMKWKDPKTDKLYDVDASKITKTALMTVEGELDDISATGQTLAAHDLCSKLPADMHYTHTQDGVGHYGIFNGRRWRDEIQPRIADFIRQIDKTKYTPIVKSIKVAKQWKKAPLKTTPKAKKS
jgi:poly(3-hydroxybutyrate) depolymerase